MLYRTIKQLLLRKPYIQEHCKQPDAHTSEEYWRMDNIKDPARPQSNTEADLLADICTQVQTKKCQSVFKLVWKD